MNNALLDLSKKKKNNNNALLGKWPWRLEDNSQGLWRLLIMAKYRLAHLG